MVDIIGVKKLTKFKWLNLYETEYALDGVTHHWTFASRKTPSTAGAPLVPDAVVVIPIYKEGRKRRLVVVKEFRVPIADDEYGFPAGLYDQNESAADVAKRELKEETGLDLTKVLYIGPPCVSSAGLSDESVVYVVCECKGKVSLEGNEGTEQITVELLDMNGIKSLRRSTNKMSAKTLPFLLMFEMMNQIHWPEHMK